MMETQMTAPLVIVMMLSSLSIPASSVSLMLFIIPFVQSGLAQVILNFFFIIPPIHSSGVDPLVGGMMKALVWFWIIDET
jgi:hypothetical protein